MIFEIGLMDQQRVIFTQQFYPLNNTRNFFVSEERKSLLELITRNALDVFNGRITLISNDQYQSFSPIRNRKKSCTLRLTHCFFI